MRCYVGTSLDSLDSYALLECPEPSPGPGEVRLKVQATALGFVDGLLALGRYQVRPQLPYVPGGEIAGVIEALGPGVDSVALGDRVVAWRLGGGLAEQVILPASDLLPIDSDMDAAVAAAILVDYQTSYYALVDVGRIKADDTVLVLGAAGGVGSAAVQMAARAGARVIAAASSAAKRQLALSLGAHASIDSSRADWRDDLKRIVPGGLVDLVFDPLGGDFTEPAFRSLGKRGRHLVVGFAAGRIPALPVNLALLKNAALLGVDFRYFREAHPQQAERNRRGLYRMVAQGYLKPPALARFDLAQAGQALAATMMRERVGKVVVSP
ncbi:MAG: NADPH:quinone oxidoreductase family protein [Quisquiliibacterium sp.]